MTACGGAAGSGGGEPRPVAIRADMATGSAESSPCMSPCMRVSERQQHAHDATMRPAQHAHAATTAPSAVNLDDFCGRGDGGACHAAKVGPRCADDGGERTPLRGAAGIRRVAGGKGTEGGRVAAVGWLPATFCDDRAARRRCRFRRRRHVAMSQLHACAALAPGRGLVWRARRPR
eukprot:102930-Chlamydomonas_euryale.AAC.4